MCVGELVAVAEGEIGVVVGVFESDGVTVALGVLVLETEGVNGEREAEAVVEIVGVTLAVCEIVGVGVELSEIVGVGDSEE